MNSTADLKQYQNGNCAWKKKKKKRNIYPQDWTDIKKTVWYEYQYLRHVQNCMTWIFNTNSCTHQQTQKSRREHPRPESFKELKSLRPSIVVEVTLTRIYDSLFNFLAEKTRSTYDFP